MIIGFEALSNNAFMLGMKERLENPKGFMFAYKGFVKRQKGLWLLSLEPQFPKMYWLGLMLFVTGFFFRGWLGWWSILVYAPGVLMGATYAFWHPSTYELLLRKQLKRKTVFYRGDELIRRLVG